MAGRTVQRLTDPALVSAAVLYGLLLGLAEYAGALGFALGIVLTLSLWRYCYEVLRATAQGKRELATVGLETMNPIGDWRLVLHFIAFPAALLALAIWLPPTRSGSLGWLAWVAMLGVLALFPASAALLALTGRLEAAFSPAAVRTVATTLGRDYVRLLGALAVLALAGLLAVAVVPGGFVGTIAEEVLLAWALLAAFALIGEALREHREEFAIPGEREPDDERRARERRAEWQKALDRAYASLRSGLATEGYEELRRLVESEGDSVEVQHWLFDKMLGWEDRSHAVAIGRRLIERYLAADDGYAALEVFRRCRHADPAFALPHEAAARLAELARSIGHHGIADEIAAGR